MQRTVLMASAVLAAAALLVPAALAQRPDDREGTIGVGSVTAPAGASSVSATRPDDRAGVRGPGAFAAERTILVSSDGFDWSDAGVGLAGGVGLVLVAGGLLVAATHRRRVQSLA